MSLITSSCSKAPKGYSLLQLKGSDTEVSLALSLAEAYMDKDSLVSIAVTGGGSGTGIAAIINGKTDIANSSRPMKEKEISLAESQGVKVFTTLFAVDALAIIVNDQNPLDGLGTSQLGEIFRGEKDNWKAFGGEDLEINLYGRQNNSGTYIFFRDNFLKADYSPEAKQMNGNAQIVAGVREDPSAIGYVGLGYVVKKNGSIVDGLKILNIAQDSLFISPLEKDNITSGAYPITRPLYQFTNGKPSGKILEFIQFELSREGQELVSREGYYPLSPEHVMINKQNGLYE
ncbi:MAG: phosphate ABC transporter substrate-binding protein [Bacteroidia bacterium]|nr:phosphate ABC transporter substrate-binding protein [Bacteroidia bacterium]